MDNKEIKTRLKKIESKIEKVSEIEEPKKCKKIDQELDRLKAIIGINASLKD